MGWTPQQVDQMSLWQWMAAVEGFNAANSPRDGNRLSADEADSLFAWVDAVPANDRMLRLVIYDWDGARPVRRGEIEFKA